MSVVVANVRSSTAPSTSATNGCSWPLLRLVLVVTVRRRSVVGAWFATMAIVQFAVYSWAGEKFAWLALHPLIPAVLLAGLGAQAVFDRLQQPRRIRRTRSDVCSPARLRCWRW